MDFLLSQIVQSSHYGISELGTILCWPRKLRYWPPDSSEFIHVAEHNLQDSISVNNIGETTAWRLKIKLWKSRVFANVGQVKRYHNLRFKTNLIIPASSKLSKLFLISQIVKWDFYCAILHWFPDIWNE